jgi:hypothetical protein
MQFGREPRSETASTMTVDGELGWVCSDNPAHFQIASERLSVGTTASP